MGFYTELIFNNIDVSAESILPLRDSARDVLCQKDCPWAYMLNYIYAESSDNEIIDLQISKEMTQHLAESYRTPVTLEQYAETHLSDNDADLNDLPWFILEWEPFDVGYSGKWYRTDEFAAWLSGFCDSGQLFQITQESGGGLWGWEFYQGRYRELELRSKGRWRKGVLPHVT